MNGESAKTRIAVLISGGGTTLKNLLSRIESGELDVEVALVISSSSEAGGIRFAEAAGIPVTVVPRPKQVSDDQYCRQIFEPCREQQIDLVVMGGFLKHVLIPDDYSGRVVNIHPSLIPSFCGKGYYGRRVHEAVLDYGAKVSGCTVHFVDNDYDHGPIIAQRVVPVLDGDSAESLAQRIFTCECELYPAVIAAFARGDLRLEGRQVTGFQA